MIGYGFYGTRNRRQAFTLLEILLTLGLLVIMAAMAWTVLEEPFSGVRLRKAAERIGAEWRTARVEAMDSGEIYVFRYAPEGNTFRVEPYSAAEGQQDSVFGDLLGGSAQAAGTPSRAQPAEGSLPEGVTFVAGETATDTRAAIIASEIEQSGTAETGWSDPILFYPDGTTSTYRLVLKNEHDRYIDVQLRGLTGVVSVGEVRSSQEPLP